MTEPERYSVVVRNVEIDGESFFRATVAELPDLSQYAATAAEAYEQAIEAIRGLQLAAEEDGAPFPEPNEETAEFSGRITLRMPPSMHAKAARLAQLDSTSLNQYLVAILAATIGAARSPNDVWNVTSELVARRHASAVTYKVLSKAARENWGSIAHRLNEISSGFVLGRHAFSVTTRADVTWPANVIPIKGAKGQRSEREAAIAEA